MSPDPDYDQATKSSDRSVMVMSHQLRDRCLPTQLTRFGRLDVDGDLGSVAGWATFATQMVDAGRVTYTVSTDREPGQR